MRTLFLIALAAGIAAPALAADPATPARTPHAGWARPDFAKMRAQHVDDVALLIGLHAEQRPALESFLSTIEPHHGPREGGIRPPEGGTPPTGDEGTLARLDRMSAHLDRRDADAKQKIEATRKFYASLNPDQQRRFDALERLHHGAMHGMHGGGWHGHGRGGPGGGPNGGRDMPPPPPQG